MRIAEEFIKFLESYPSGAHPTKKALDEFRRGLDQYREGLNERYGSVKNDLCTGLKMLSVRFTKDFDWLYRQDQGLFFEIRGILDQSYQSEGMVINIADQTCHYIDGLIDSTDEKTPAVRRKAIAEAVRRYRDEAAAEVQALHGLAFQAGASLLTVEEYELALRASGSGDTRIMVLGELTMSGGDTFKNISGQVVSRSALNNVVMTVGASTALPSKEREDLVRLLSELDAALEPVRKAKPEVARRVERQAETVAEEVAGGKTDRSFLDITVQGLKQAAEAVKDIAPAVLEVTGRIVSFLTGLPLP